MSAHWGSIFAIGAFLLSAYSGNSSMVVFLGGLFVYLAINGFGESR
jgi:hypothetical protein